MKTPSPSPSPSSNPSPSPSSNSNPNTSTSTSKKNPDDGGAVGGGVAGGLIALILLIMLIGYISNGDPFIIIAFMFGMQAANYSGGKTSMFDVGE